MNLSTIYRRSGVIYRQHSPTDVKWSMLSIRRLNMSKKRRFADVSRGHVPAVDTSAHAGMDNRLFVSKYQPVCACLSLDGRQVHPACPGQEAGKGRQEERSLKEVSNGRD